ncbi:Fic family protein [Chitinophaga sp. sic0106]|uniref:Fic family protein n=1 Tax=Chitinophaga sp. sic0106 TaxID=2854785 RepID=UPI001C4840BC|nr:Fic family protein [Chitinophaga sp. sic0106]MBV7532156.1 Fic family protein [Chitinophaga sp. sic0106]
MKVTVQQIDQLIKEWQTLQPVNPKYQQEIDKKFRLEFNYNSNHIEGNTLTYGETALLLFFDKTSGNHDLREFEEMKAHDVAFDIVKKWSQNTEYPLNERDLKNLHEILLVRPFWKDAITSNGTTTRRQIEIGNYKKYPNSVLLQNGEIFHYTSPEDTPIEMGELISWYRSEEEKKELHPVALAALLHYKFVRIHPFDDGNGRMSRLLMNFVLLKYGLPPVVIKASDKKNYLFALNQADTGDLNAFITYVSAQLTWSLELSIKGAKGESLEEEDDIDKEIAIWKRQQNTPHQESIRSNASIYTLYFQHGLRELILEFEESHRPFHEMFHQIRPYFIIDQIPLRINVASTLEEFDKEMNYFASETQIRSTNIDFGINLIEYKFNLKETFDLKPQLKVNLNFSNYTIGHNQHILLTKNYTEGISEEERQKIIATVKKDTFSAIKKLSEGK